MTYSTTYTAICSRSGYVFVKEGTLEQVQAILKEGYCIARKELPFNGNTILFLGLVL